MDRVPARPSDPDPSSTATSLSNAEHAAMEESQGHTL
jgi:hypothetical protein